MRLGGGRDRIFDGKAMVMSALIGLVGVLIGLVIATIARRDPKRPISDTEIRLATARKFRRDHAQGPYG